MATKKTQQAGKAAGSAAAESGAGGYVQPGRVGKKSLVGYFDKDAHKAVKQLALDLDRKVEELMGEAFHDLLVKHGRTDAAKHFKG
jgi:hypothetical protein